jgi:hypothetical protein
MLQRHFASTGFAAAALLAAALVSAAQDTGAAAPTQEPPGAPVARPTATDSSAPSTTTESSTPDSKAQPTAADATAADSSGQSPEYPPGSVKAIWKTQKIDFHYQSFTTFYACNSLEDRIERLLKAMGASAKVRVRSPECPTRIATMPRVLIDVTSPVEATPAALAEQAKGKGTRELTARVQGKHPEEMKGEDPFAAQWKRLSLSRGKLDLEPGDCELIDELRRKVLPKLAVRIVDNGVQCTPHQLSLGQPRLEVEALVEIPKPDAKEEKKDPKIELNVRTE